MDKTFVTCPEHEHCQQEIQKTAWDDKPNTYIVIHHLDADVQFFSPISPEGSMPSSERLNEIEKRLTEVERDRLMGLTPLSESVTLLSERVDGFIKQTEQEIADLTGVHTDLKSVQAVAHYHPRRLRKKKRVGRPI